MAKWIFLVALCYVGAVLGCREGERRKIDGICKSIVCISGTWYRDECMAAFMNITENIERLNYACRDDESYKDAHDPDIYYQCNQGKIVLRRCEPGLEFDNEKKICLTPPEKIPEPRPRFLDSDLDREDSDSGASMCEENTLYADLFESKTYYKCINGKLFSHACFGDAVFDSEKQECVSSHSNSGVAKSVIAKEEQCNHGETRKKEGSCKEYYECRHGTETVARCMECQNYDENERKCRYVFDSPCKSKFPEPPTTSTPKDLSTEVPEKCTENPSPADTTASVTEVIDTSTRTTESEVTSSTPTGAENEVSTPTITPVTEPLDSPEPGSTPLPFGDCKQRRALPDCKYYLECHDGELVTRRCGWLQYFDSVTSSCSFMGYTCYRTE